MDIINNYHSERSDECRKLKDLWPKVSQVETLIKELESAWALPLVDEDGSSECPFAEDLYARKEEAEAKLIDGVRMLEGYLPLLDKEISRCRSNLDRIRSDSQLLNRPEAQDSYGDAQKEQHLQYRMALAHRQQVEFVLQKAQIVLERAGGKKFPGREPQRSGPMAGDPSSTPLPAEDIDPIPPFDEMVKEPGGTLPSDGTFPPVGPIPPGVKIPPAPIVTDPGLHSGDDDDEVEGMISTGPLA